MCNWKCASPAKSLVKKLEIPIRDTALFFQYVVCDQESDGETWVGVISNRRGKLRLLGLQEEPPLSIPSLSGISQCPHKENPCEGVWPVYAYSNDFEKCEWAFSFKVTKFTACMVKDEKDVTNYLMVFNLLKLSIHFKVRNI